MTRGSTTTESARAKYLARPTEVERAEYLRTHPEADPRPRYGCGSFARPDDLVEPLDSAGERHEVAWVDRKGQRGRADDTAVLRSVSPVDVVPARPLRELRLVARHEGRS